MTIYALSSGPGIAGISVIRISGSKTRDVIINLTQKEAPEPRVATLRKFNKINNNELIDEGILIWFPGPNSYTGEDMAEFHVHGSKAVVDSIQATISKIDGCRLADPGEFTKIAFQNDKIDLLKAESIGDLIHAETELQRDQAVKLVQGNASNYYNDLREKIIKSLAFIEAKIDFAEEDLPEKVLKDAHKSIKEIHSEIIKVSFFSNQQAEQMAIYLERL